MTSPDEPVSILELYTAPSNVLEIHTDPIAVLQIATPGPAGPPGPPGVRFTATFDPERVYFPGDLVTYNGVLYISEGISVEGALPTDPLFWTPISYGGALVKFVSDVPLGTAVLINHGLGTEDVDVVVRDSVTNEVVYPGVNIIDLNYIELTFGYLSLNPSNGTFYVTVKAVI